MVLHGPSIHFHLGAWAVTAIATFIAFWLNFFEKRKVEFLGNEIPPDLIEKLDYVAHITGIVGLAGVFLAGITGLVDASGLTDTLIFTPQDVLKGYENSMANEHLSFKVMWTIVGAQAFIFAGALRFYFTTYRGESVYDQNPAIQVLYAEGLMLGFLIQVVIAGVGGLYTYQASMLEYLPLLDALLPGRGDILPLVSILSLMLAGMLLVTTVLVREAEARAE